MGTPNQSPSSLHRRRESPARTGSRIRFFAPLLVLLALPLGPLPVRAAADLRILVDGKSVSVTSSATAVRAVLAEAHVTVDKEDEVTPSLDSPLPTDGVIHVARLAYREGTVDVKIPYQTIVRSATRGNRPYHPTVTGEGRPGLKRISYRAKNVDGQEVSRATLSEEVVREPVPQIVTSRNPGVLASRGAYAGRRTFTMLATAYDPGPGSCGKYANGRTCNGKRAGYGIVAVDPKLIPLGTKLFVPGYGYGIAADVGRAIQGAHVDLGFNSRSGSMQWGKKWVTVQVVD